MPVHINIVCYYIITLTSIIGDVYLHTPDRTPVQTIKRSCLRTRAWQGALLSLFLLVKCLWASLILKPPTWFLCLGRKPISNRVNMIQGHTIIYR
ncbi:hypothetical protein JB92DRAFT_2041479 [Gautieria morchelliformis]|nr:hypothetical protein JB92DRAFT_2041479 [Gautieria morchelliformis]